MSRAKEGKSKNRFRLAGLSLILAGLWSSAWAAQNRDVTLHVTDMASGKPVVARVYIWREGVPILPAGFPSYDKGREKHFLVSGDAGLRLPEGTYRLRFEKGLEYFPEELELQVAKTIERTVTMKRWVDMNERGWYSADMHVHRDPADLATILRAEELNFAPTITTHIWGADVNRPWSAPVEFPVVVDARHFYTANAQEVERIQGGPGAVILLAPDLPIPFSGHEFYPPSSFYTRKVHEQGGLVEGDKLFWLDTFVNAALGEIDFIEINCNHFVPRSVETDLVPWSRWPMELGYRGNRGFALWMMDSYYRILNSGIHLPLSAGSACGVKETPVGFDRVYARLGETRLTYESLMEALQAGRSFSTNGPVLGLQIDGREGPGTILEANPGQTYEITGSTKSKGPLESLELIVNGRVVARALGNGEMELGLSHSLQIDRSSWIALRSFEKCPLDNIFAHTSPAYLLVERRPVLVADDISDLIEKVDELIDYTRKVDGFRSENHRRETLELYHKARAVYSERLRSAKVSP